MTNNRWKIVFLLLCLFLEQAAFASDLSSDRTSSVDLNLVDTTEVAIPDTLALQVPQKNLAIHSSEKLVSTEAWKPNSTRAIIYSAILPGAGQIYNRKYWKLPIVWGAFTGCAYAILWNNKTYKEYQKGYADFMSGDPSLTSWHNFLPYGADPAEYVDSDQLRARLKRGNDYYRRNRDLSIIVTIGVYFLTMLDAYVDAELFDFNISPDLSLNLMPFLGRDENFGFLRYGVNCGFSF